MPLLSAGLLYLSFFPLAIGWLAWVALVPWLSLVRLPRTAGRLYQEFLRVPSISDGADRVSRRPGPAGSTRFTVPRASTSPVNMIGLPAGAASGVAGLDHST